MKKILITGSNSGLGRHLVSKFESEGFEIFKHMGSKHYDLSKIKEIERLAQDAKNFGVNILINNAAIVCPGKEFTYYSTNEISDMIDVNLKAPILLTFYLMNQLTDLININSMVGMEIKPKRTLYSASKWGLRGFSQSFKEENKKINVLDIYPTNIKTSQDKQNAMEIDFVVDSIYNSFVKKEKILILDGRE